jgi:hypothetical protein
MVGARLSVYVLVRCPDTPGTRKAAKSMYAGAGTVILVEVATRKKYKMKK